MHHLGKFVKMKAAPNNVAMRLNWKLYSTYQMYKQATVSALDSRLLRRRIIVAVELNLLQTVWEEWILQLK